MHLINQVGQAWLWLHNKYIYGADEPVFIIGARTASF